MSAQFLAFQSATYQLHIYLQDNDQRLSSLIRLTSISLEDALRQLVSEATPDKEDFTKRVVSVCLVLFKRLQQGYNECRTFA